MLVFALVLIPVDDQNLAVGYDRWLVVSGTSVVAITGFVPIDTDGSRFGVPTAVIKSTGGKERDNGEGGEEGEDEERKGTGVGHSLRFCNSLSVSQIPGLRAPNTKPSKTQL
ncbi:hypothetical protein Gotur_034448 [Gossypium turneri]